MLVNVVVSTAVVYRAGRRRGLALPGPGVAVGMVLVCIAGSKLLGSAIQLIHFRGHLTSYFLFRDEGFTILGGVLVSLPAGFLYCRRAGLPFYRLGIPCAMGLTVFTILQRAICFANGCCFGRPTASPLGYRFPPHTDAGSLFPGVPVHPTQLYTVVLYLGVLAFLVRFNRRVSDRLLFGAFMILVGAERLTNETLRWHTNNDIVLLADGQVITGHALIALTLLVYGLTLCLAELRRPAARSAAEADVEAA